jgi:hypothetical protein
MTLKRWKTTLLVVGALLTVALVDLAAIALYGWNLL